MGGNSTSVTPSIFTAVPRIPFAGTPAVVLPSALEPSPDMGEFRRITSLNFYPDGIIPPDSQGETIILPPSVLPPEEPVDPQKVERDQDVAVQLAMRRDYEKMIEPYPLLRDAVRALGLFAAAREGRAVPALQGDDARLTGIATIDTGALIAQAVEKKQQLAKLHADVDRVDADIRRLSFKAASELATEENSGNFTLYEQALERYGVPAKEKQVVQLKKDITTERESLKGMVNQLVLQHAMLALSKGASEDDVLTSAGLTMGAYGLDQEAFSTMQQAHEVAGKLNDNASLMRLNLYLIKYNPSFTTDQKIASYDSYVSQLDATVGLDGYDSGVDANVELNRDVRRNIQSALKSYYTDLRTEAVKEWMHLAAVKAGDDPEDENFVRVLAMLDRAIQVATASADATAEQVSNLAQGAAFATEPFVLDGADAVRQARIKLCEERRAPIFERAGRVEKMYVHLKDVASDEAESPSVTNAMGMFGSSTYFYAYQKTGFAYDAALNVFTKLMKDYPDSEILQSTIASIRDAAPHLFDAQGNFMDPARHVRASDAAQARSEVEMLHIAPGSLPAQMGADYAAATAGAATLAKGGALACGVLGPEASAVCGGVGGIVGFVGGSAGGMAIVHAVYSDEIETLAHQAEMTGMKLSRLTPGDGNLEIAKTVGFFALTVPLAPIGGKSSVKLVEKLSKVLSKKGLKHLAQGSVEEFWHGVALFPAGWRGLKGFFGIAERTGQDLQLLPVAEQIAKALGISKTTRANLDAVETLIIREARGALTSNISSSLDSCPAEFAESLAKAIIPDGVVNGSPNRLRKFSGLVGKVRDGMTRPTFEQKALGILGEENRGVVRSLANRLYAAPSGVSPRMPAINLSAALKSSTTGTVHVNTLVSEVVELLGIVGDDATEMAARMTASMRFSSVESLLRVARLLKQEGTEAIQIERLLKDIVRDEKSSREVLETILTAVSREEVVAKAKLAGYNADPHALVGLLTAKNQEAVRAAVRTVLGQEATVRKLGTGEFAKALNKIDGMPDLIARVNVNGYDLTTAGGRQDLIRYVSHNPELCDEFLNKMLGKGLDKAAVRALPGDAKKLLMEALVKPDVGINLDLQHALKDTFRPVLHSWRQTNPWEVLDVAARSDLRANQRILGQAHVLLDEEGQAAVTDLVAHIAPWRMPDLEPHIGKAVGMMRQDARKSLVGQLTKAMKYTFEDGVFDSVLRPMNAGYDGMVGWVDRFFARRFGMAARAIRAGNPSMDVAVSPLLMRKMLMRQAYLAQQVVVKTTNDGELGPILRRVESAYNWMSSRVGTEEFRRAHRLCIPVALADKAFDEHHKLGTAGVICAIVGGNYYLQKFGMSNTHALDIAMTQRTIGSALAKSEGDSDDLFDVQRTGASAGEAVAGQVIQSFLMYGLNFAEKTSYGQLIGNVPLLRRIPMAMNSSPFFGLFKGSLAKPEFIDGVTWASARGVAFTSTMSTAQSFAIGWVFKKKELFNGSTDYPVARGVNYALNGPLVNVPGFWVNKTLERNNPDADLRSTLRQLVERVIGTGTQWLSWKVADALAGKVEYNSKENRLLDEAIAGKSETGTEAWDLFARRYSMDILGLWYRIDDDRTLKPHVLAPSVHLEQMRSWYTEAPIEYPDKVNRPGYFVDLARNHPDRLSAFLKQAERQMSDPHAPWREDKIWRSKQADEKLLYYFSLMAKHFDHRFQEGKVEYKPFHDFIVASPHIAYWSAVPECATEADLRKAIIRMEDHDKVHDTPNGNDNDTLDDQLALLRVSNRRYKQ